ncbi:MAG: polysaccharide biosynthesis protein [Crocinitomicaceae bacterium]|nr:polysaccharide biosynthesis protein [Crocinitomicaceae bacterium]
MSVFKKLAGQTAIYGSSSIIGRFLNFLLTPLYALQFTNEQYGIITEMYAYVAFLVVLLTYGMETSYFRFSTLKEHRSTNVYSNTLYSLLTSSSFFVVLISIFSQDIANWLQYPNHFEYIIWFGIIVALDAISSIPLAKLRSQARAKKFALVNFANVGVNISLNLFFIYYCKSNFDSGNTNWIVNHLYNPEIGVGYVFISNLISSIIKFLLLLPEMSFKGSFDFLLLKKMLSYSMPMLFVGLAYVINETLDRAMLKNILFDMNISNNYSSSESLTMALEQNGIYGANYKITMIVTMFIQAFRYASEPFFFKNESDKNSKEIISKMMTYLVIVLVFIFLLITLYLHLFKYFIPDESYWSGLFVVPFLLGANICLGIYTTLSIWYKLSKQTIFGAYISGFGALLTLGLNYLLIPKFGFAGCAYTTLACYFSMMVVSYLIGRKYYPIPYNLKSILFYIVLGAIIYLISLSFNALEMYNWKGFAYHTFLLLTFVIIVYFKEVGKEKVVLS